MKRLWKKFKPFITPCGRYSSATNELHDEFDDMLQKVHSTSSIPEKQKYIKRMEQTQHKLSKLNFKFSYQLTSNRMNMSLWGYWWFLAGLWGWKLYFEFNWLYLGMCVFASILLFLYGKHMLINKKKREELFIEGI